VAVGTVCLVGLAEGQVIELVLASSSNHPTRLPVSRVDFFQAAFLSSAELRLNDARVHLRVVSIADEHLRARVTCAGLLSAHKGVTYLALDFRSEALSDQGCLQLRRYARTVAFLLLPIDDLATNGCQTETNTFPSL
jgi:pyruvate kinase